jgi:hypothetical protein
MSNLDATTRVNAATLQEFQYRWDICGLNHGANNEHLQAKLEAAPDGVTNQNTLT